MFRNPRDQSEIDVGRPPTPPPRRSSPPKMQKTSPYFGGNAASPQQPKGFLVGKKKPFAAGNGKTKPNASILNFFQKESPAAAANGSIVDEMFFADKHSRNDKNEDVHTRERSLSPSRMFLDGGVNLGSATFGEDEVSSKRRKLSHTTETPSMPSTGDRTPPPPVGTQSYQAETVPSGEGQGLSRKTDVKPKRRIGGFIDDSDSEDDAINPPTGFGDQDTIGLKEDQAEASMHNEDMNRPMIDGTHSPSEVLDESSSREVNSNHPYDMPPSLKHESTSMFDPGDFDEDFDEEEFYEQGEEYLERRWMQEQQELEMRMGDTKTPGDLDRSSSSTGPGLVPGHDQGGGPEETTETACPVCGTALDKSTEAEASEHVNQCLDGTSTTQSMPKLKSALPIVESPKQATSTVPPPKRFQRAAIARPAQENPFSFGSETQGGSAFSKLMSGHAEDAAWVVAAANETKSRGRPAWERTCPFYKILPGFFICVDGFRYGAVQGCNAYFLSHFHSDHYIGLTASWRHGPIYCSKVTANLVKQQLKVDPKYVRALEWDETVEVPETNGVVVTMIPANHCPGSSLFLFEKTVGKGATPRKHRVLHCGDFRACPAHVSHPLLRPDIVDRISGKKKQQSVDVCYLDTTYLTPKYSFPSQEDVIESCAQMCVSLSKEMVDIGDAWEKVKRERAGTGMVKFLDKEPKINSQDDFIKQEGVEEMKPKSRGRLLVVIGTYSIGKERICLGIARALNCKIYAPPSKQRICAALEDPELSSLLTTDPLEAQIHMQMLMEIRAETLAEYLQSFKPHFTRVVGFRPTGWNYRPPSSRFTDNPAVSTVLHSDGWKSRFTMKDLVPQRGSTRESNCFGVPYSEHSSFRELTMFCCALRIAKVIPTVNVGSKKSRERMKMWVDKWDAERKKNGLFQVAEGATSW